MQLFAKKMLFILIFQIPIVATGSNHLLKIAKKGNKRVIIGNKGQTFP